MRSAPPVLAVRLGLLDQLELVAQLAMLGRPEPQGQLVNWAPQALLVGSEPRAARERQVKMAPPARLVK